MGVQRLLIYPDVVPPLTQPGLDVVLAICPTGYRRPDVPP